MYASLAAVTTSLYPLQLSMNLPGIGLPSTHATCSPSRSKSRPTMNENAMKYKNDLELLAGQLDKYIKHTAELAEQAGGFGEGESEMFGDVGDAYDHIFGNTWKKWESKSAMKAVEYFIYSMKEAEHDFLSQFDSIDNALDAIPQPSSSTVRVYTPLKDMKLLPPDGKWAKEGAKHTAECVHILNENLKTMASKLDKHSRAISRQWACPRSPRLSRRSSVAMRSTCSSCHRRRRRHGLHRLCRGRTAPVTTDITVT